jgi:hypothetical protein
VKPHLLSSSRSHLPRPGGALIQDFPLHGYSAAHCDSHTRRLTISLALPPALRRPQAKAVFVDQAPLQNRAPGWSLGSKGCFDEGSLQRLTVTLLNDMGAIADGNAEGARAPTRPAGVRARDRGQAKDGVLWMPYCNGPQHERLPQYPKRTTVFACMFSLHPTATGPKQAACRCQSRLPLRPCYEPRRCDARGRRWPS